MRDRQSFTRQGRLVAGVLGRTVCCALATATFLDAQTARPARWVESTHGMQAPNYSRLFAMDKVHELNITIAPESFRQMKADLETVVPMRGAPPFGAFVPPDGRGGFGPGSNSSLVTTWRSGSDKLPFRLNLDGLEARFPEIRDQTFFGFPNLSFSNNALDSSYLRAKVVADPVNTHGIIRTSRASSDRPWRDSTSPSMNGHRVHLPPGAQFCACHAAPTLPFGSGIAVSEDEWT